MVGVDTNVLVRLLIADDKEQAARAARLFERERIFISKTVLLETDWVLRSAYGLLPLDVGEALRKLLGLSNVQVEDEASVIRALAWQGESLDFADALHLASSDSCTAFATFDRKFIRAAAARSKDLPLIAP